MKIFGISGMCGFGMLEESSKKAKVRVLGDEKKEKGRYFEIDRK